MHLTGDDLVVLGRHAPATEQMLERALATSQAEIGRRLVRADPRLEGYGWYDRLGVLDTMRIVVKQGDTIHVIDDSSDAPDLSDSRLDAIAFELGIRELGMEQVHQLNTDLLLLPNDDYDVDLATFGIVPSFAAGAKPMIPALLSFYLDAAYFVSSDDRDCDSWHTQLADFQRDSRRLALTLLGGEDAAIRIAIEEAVLEHVAWLVPTGSRLALTLTEGVVDLALSPGAERPSDAPGS